MNDLTITEPANVDSIRSRILTILGVQVMLDRDLAELYGVPTKRLNEQVKRNARRFPDNFMFQLTKEELEDWRSQIATSNVMLYGNNVNDNTSLKQSLKGNKGNKWELSCSVATCHFDNLVQTQSILHVA